MRKHFSGQRKTLPEIFSNLGSYGVYRFNEWLSWL